VLVVSRGEARSSGLAFDDPTLPASSTRARLAHE
jgi:hypothetical protein